MTPTRTRPPWSTSSLRDNATQGSTRLAETSRVHLAAAAARLLDDDVSRAEMKAELQKVAVKLAHTADPMCEALTILGTLIKKKDYAVAAPSPE